MAEKDFPKVSIVGRDKKGRFVKGHIGYKYWLGKSMPKEAVEMMRAKKIGKTSSFKGRVHSKESIEKMRRVKLGKIPSLETRLKMSKASKGERNFRWKGGITPEMTKIRNSPEYREWRRQVYKNDKFCCRECGAKMGWDKESRKNFILHAHHIKPFALYPETRFSVENGITLCWNCHKETETYARK